MKNNLIESELLSSLLNMIYDFHYTVNTLTPHNIEEEK
jgi:hypothetical protein